jgi:hypothetical protein
VLVLAAVALVDVALLLAVVHFLGGDSTLAQSVTGAAAAIGALIFKPGFAYLAALASRKPALIGGSLLLGAMTASAIIAALVALVLLVAGLSRVAGGGSSGRLFA